MRSCYLNTLVFKPNVLQTWIRLVAQQLTQDMPTGQGTQLPVMLPGFVTLLRLSIVAAPDMRVYPPDLWDKATYLLPCRLPLIRP
jgi:hypothetical protein